MDELDMDQISQLLLLLSCHDHSVLVAFILGPH